MMSNKPLVARLFTGIMECSDVILPECAATDRLRELKRGYLPYIEPRTFTKYAGHPIPPMTVPDPDSSPRSRGVFSREDTQKVKELLQSPEFAECLKGMEFEGEFRLMGLYDLT
jgi:hypothetical protein